MYMTDAHYAATAFYVSAKSRSQATKINWDHTSIKTYLEEAHPDEKNTGENLSFPDISTTVIRKCRECFQDACKKFVLENNILYHEGKKVTRPSQYRPEGHP